MAELATVPPRPSAAGKCSLVVNKGRTKKTKLDPGVREMCSGMFCHKGDPSLV